MAADTKRGVDMRDIHITGQNFTLGEVERALARHGLHVVTAADKAVLDAMAATHPGDLREWVEIHGEWSPGLRRALRAELARRQGTGDS